MGAWGIGIFQNDTALDIKDEYIELLKEGKSSIEASDIVIEKNQDYINLGAYDELEFWLALAQIQWDYGRLQTNVKQKALEIVEGDWHYETWKDSKPKILVERINVIKQFIELINSPQPLEKKVKVSIPFNCIWNIGDIFAYQLQSEESKKNNCYHHFVIFQKIGVQEAYPKLTIPILRVAKKIYENIPSVEEFINEKKMPQFWGPEDYTKEEYYFTKVLYDLPVKVSSLRSYPKNITFLGNQYPIKEEIMEDTGDGYNYIEWKDFEYFYFMMYDIWKNIDIVKILKK